MLRKLIAGVIVVNFVFMLVSALTTSDLMTSEVAIADNTATFGVGAIVPDFLEINAVLHELDDDGEIIWTSNPQSLNFGTLQPVMNETTVWFMESENAYAVVAYPVSSGRAYQLGETGTMLTNGAGDTIPDGAYVMTPDYQYLDEMGGGQQGAMPAGAYLSPPDSAVGINRVVYTSDASGTGKAIRAYLSIRGPDENGEIKNYREGHDGGTGVGQEQFYYDPSNPGASNWEPVTQSQSGGSYSGSVTFTLNLQ